MFIHIHPFWIRSQISQLRFSSFSIPVDADQPPLKTGFAPGCGSAIVALVQFTSQKQLRFPHSACGSPPSTFLDSLVDADRRHLGVFWIRSWMRISKLVDWSKLPFKTSQQFLTTYVSFGFAPGCGSLPPTCFWIRSWMRINYLVDL